MVRREKRSRQTIIQMHDGLNEMSDRPHHNIKPRGHHNNIRRQCLTKGVSTVGSNVTRRP